MKFKWKNCIKIGVTGLILYLAIHYWPALSNLLSIGLTAAVPLLIGCLVAFIVNLPMSFYERHFAPKSKSKVVNAIRRPVCLILAYLSIALIVFLVINLVVPELISCVKLLIEQIIAFATSLEEKLNVDFAWTEEINSFIQNVNWEEVIKKVSDWLTTGLGGALSIVFTTVSTVFSSIIMGFLAFAFSIYVLASKEKLGKQINRLMDTYIKPKISKRIRYVVSAFNDAFHKYIVGQCLEAVILGTLCIIGMLIFGFPYAMTIGALISFTAFIPFVGAFIGAAVGAFLILTVSPIKAILFLVFIVILQQLENNLIYPKVVGTSIGLPGIWVLAAVTIGGSVLGIAGMLLGVPLAAAFYNLLKANVAERGNHPEDEYTSYTTTT